MDSYKTDCTRIDRLFMNHMDGLITAAEHDEVRSHIAECAQCSEDFEVYETIRLTLSAKEHVCSAPEGFEESVMQKISQLPRSAGPVVNAAYLLIGMLIISIGGLGTVFFEDIAGALRRIDAFPISLPALEALFENIAIYLSSFIAAMGDISVSLFEMLAQAQLVLLLIFVLLITLQFFVYKYDKA
ncbi:MAG: zf-HC2 domain-containing protein [Defluviitaleaceae bacterium]|nr:zf-HC2 domain-containing protein [Defluviitaleaceae bacterium]